MIVVLIMVVSAGVIGANLGSASDQDVCDCLVNNESYSQ